MVFSKNLRERKLNRLRKYDYSSSGYYFVTICTRGMFDYFGNVVNRKMVLNECGEIVNKFWLEITKHYRNILLDEFVVMPNHVHGIIIIQKSVNTSALI